MKASVVIPVYNGAGTLAACVRALKTQTLTCSEFEIVVVDDGSTDRTADVARHFDVRLISQRNGGAPAARNRGMREARGEWVAFTDADCVPSRAWLQRLLAACADRASLGAAGKTVGIDSHTPAARFVDLMGGLDAGRHLAHPTYPFAPSANIVYRRDCLLEAGGFDERYTTYDACDLHTRLRRRYGNAFAYEPRALVLHRHRAQWGQYWRQQYFYGIGYAQFMLAYHNETSWTVHKELRALGELAWQAAAAALPGKGDAALARRGRFVRGAAQHAGFLRAYYNLRERRRW